MPGRKRNAYPPKVNSKLEQQLGIGFHNERLLLQAITHRSYVNENKGKSLDDNERLEFLGDAVIDFLSGMWLYGRFPDWREGQLTRLRAALVRTEMLSQFAVQCGIDNIMRLGKGEEANGGRSRPTLLCDTFEAVIGALYLDQGIEAAATFLKPMFDPALERISREVNTKDPKSRLQEWSQTLKGHPTPQYHLIAGIGPEHAKLFVMEVTLQGQQLGWGSGRSKRKAQQSAARMALKEIE